MKGCRPLTREEEALLLRNLGLREVCIIELGINFGFRVSELLSLKVKDVWFDRKVKERVELKRCNTKGKIEGRSQLINKHAKIILEKYIVEKGLDEESFLFPNNRGKALSRIRVWQIINDIAKKCGITGKLGTHCLRKTFAHRVYDITEKDLIKVQKALGHLSIKSTQSYLGVEQKEIDDAIANI